MASLRFTQGRGESVPSPGTDTVLLKHRPGTAPCCTQHITQHFINPPASPDPPAIKKPSALPSVAIPLPQAPQFRCPQHRPHCFSLGISLTHCNPPASLNACSKQIRKNYFIFLHGQRLKRQHFSVKRLIFPSLKGRLFSSEHQNCSKCSTAGNCYLCALFLPWEQSCPVLCTFTMALCCSLRELADAFSFLFFF